jgi:hypothetical protein
MGNSIGILIEDSQDKMATSIAGYRGHNWTDRLFAFASLHSVGCLDSAEY